MKWIDSCIIAISMYSKIPMPAVEWTKDRMSHVMGFFPFVGVFEGILLWLWLSVGGDRLLISQTALALVGGVLPLLVTGGIHMDGFLDTMDAIHSYGSREKKLEILKDPHLGAFAVISFGIYMLLYLGVFSEYVSLTRQLPENRRLACYGALGVLFIMERAFSGFSVITFPQAKKEGLAAGFEAAAKKKGDCILLCLWMAGSSFLFLSLFQNTATGGIKLGILVVLSLFAVLLFLFFCYRRMAVKEFGGVTGDLAGWFLQVCELAGMGALVLLLRIGISGGLWK